VCSLNIPSVKTFLEEMNLPEAKSRKHLMLALMLTHFGEEYESFNENEFKGSPIFDSTVDELIETMRIRKEEILKQSNNEDKLSHSKSDQEINRTILILLMSVYAEIYHILWSMYGLDFNKSFYGDAGAALEYSLFRVENQIIREKLTGLISLLDKYPTEPQKNHILEIAHLNMELAMELMDTEIVQSIFHGSGIDVNGRIITKAEFDGLYQENLERISAENAELDAEKELELAATAARAAKAAENAKKRNEHAKFGSLVKNENLTDEQWMTIKPLIAEPKRSDNGRGRPRIKSREVLDAALWILRTGASWQELPNQFPSYRLCYSRFKIWVNDGTLKNILETLVKNSTTLGESNLHKFFVNGTFVLPQEQQRNRQFHRYN
jgi:transposase